MKTERIAIARLLETEKRDRLFSLADAIKDGSVFICPTETIYGIGGAYGVSGVSERIREIKGCIADKALILMAANRSQFKCLDISFPPAAEKLAQRFWPGNLTMVLPSQHVENGIAVRISSHPFITALSAFVSAPLYSTSANMSARPYVGDPDAIFSLFSGKVSFMVDAGPLPVSPPSTVVNVTSDNDVVILRQGSLSQRQILEVVD
ncbi:MAG: L-threonylcarbamoyladenylate synthase [Chitinispirillaceae bacterium]|nr:L-threonylcarbamoyladenylate synthase [Chitinispirillaceae bacterium]